MEAVVLLFIGLFVAWAVVKAKQKGDSPKSTTSKPKPQYKDCTAMNCQNGQVYYGVRSKDCSVCGGTGKVPNW